MRWPRLVVLGALSAFGPLSMDMYLPATPAVAADLHASQALVQLTMSGCVAGLALGQLVAGPLSDSLGRRRPLTAGLIGFAVLSLACAAAPDIWLLIALRFLQGMAGAAGIVVSLATVRDLHGGSELARILGSLTLVSGLAPVLAPVVGGMLLQVTTWRGVFCVLAALGAVLLAASRLVPETVPPPRRSPARFGRMVADTRTLARDRQFTANAITVALSTAALFTYISSLPFIVEDSYRASAQQFSLVFAVNSLGLMAMGQLSARLARRFRPAVLLRAGLAAQAAGAVGMIAAALAGHPPLIVLLAPVFVVVASFGMIRPNATALALAGHAAIAGTASAFVGAGQFLAGGLLAPIAGIGGQGTPLPAALLIGVLATAALASRALSARADRGAGVVRLQPPAAEHGTTQGPAAAAEPGAAVCPD